MFPGFGTMLKSRTVARFAALRLPSIGNVTNSSIPFLTQTQCRSGWQPGRRYGANDGLRARDNLDTSSTFGQRYL